MPMPTSPPASTKSIGAVAAAVPPIPTLEVAEMLRLMPDVALSTNVPFSMPVPATVNLAR